MTKPRKRGEEIRGFILETVAENPSKTIAYTKEKFKISRQAIHQHIKHLVSQGALIRVGYGSYELQPQEKWDETIFVADNLHEDVVWINRIAPKMGNLPDNALDIWRYGFTEMFNNVADHSESSIVWISIQKTPHRTKMDIADFGVGIFNKIRNAMNLLDERHAIIELTMGKLTTDPKSHAGESIFFTSRMFDVFHILSGEAFLTRSCGKDEDWILQTGDNYSYSGTWIHMELKNNTSRTKEEVFHRLLDDSYGFTKTVLPLRLAQYGNEKFISRSQAKRLLERMDRFKTVLFDFAEVETIGQAFADEVFRVFANECPQVVILPINANADVTQVIKKATSGTQQGQGQLF